MNLLEGKVVARNGARHRWCSRATARRRSRWPRRPAPRWASIADGAKVILGIRPEAVSDLEGVDKNARTVATFDSTVEIVEPAGSDTFVVTKIAGQEVTARMRADADVRVGKTHAFAFNLDKAVLFDPVTTRRI